MDGIPAASGSPRARREGVGGRLRRLRPHGGFAARSEHTVPSHIGSGLALQRRLRLIYGIIRTDLS